MEVLTAEAQRKYKEKLIGLFSRFITFCEDNSLNYYCAGGTALGAVRHHGFIPWDDDIDLCMLREDYNKLICLKEDLSKIGIGIEGLQIEGSKAVFLKVWDKSTTLWEIEEIPFAYGVFIDIFPLDYSDDSPEQFLKKYKKRRVLCRIYQLSQIRFSIKAFVARMRQRDMKFIVKDLLSILLPSFLQGCLRRIILKEDKKTWCPEGEKLASYYGGYFERELFKKEWFERVILVDFENIKVRISANYDDFLTQIYHDYMKLPPVEQQVSHHYHFYLNMDRGLSLDEIRKEMKK